MTNKEPILSFDFANYAGKVEPLTFKHPSKVIIANTIEEVLPCLQAVQEAVNGGYYAAGYLSYESAPAFDSAFKVRDGRTMPLLWFGIFTEPYQEKLRSTGHYTLTEWKPSVNKEEYHTSILAIKEAIKNGVTYQTNYTIRLHSTFHGDDLAYYETLKKAQASNYCAYIHTGEHSILSASPELFFQLKENEITTRPMKGTAKRGKSFVEDEATAKWLYNSEKNRAENVMIVDLLRNDLNIFAKPGTVKVPNLFEIEQYPTVHQMTSTITAQVNDDTMLVDIFRGLFPCGSITGAPKISTMKIIAEIETSPREVYCGAVGFISPNKQATFNVPIRTVLIDHQSGEATYGVGGGITWDSTTEAEYQEVLAKASLLTENRPEFQLLESLLLNSGEYFLQEEHFKRLQHSAQYFGFQCNLNEVKNSLSQFAHLNNKGKLKVRLLMTKTGELAVEGNPISELKSPLKAVLADSPINQDNLFLYHKTTNRDIYYQFQSKKPLAAFDVLLWNKDEQLTEFTNGNVVLEIDGGLYTPPIKSGLLAGTYREFLIVNKKIIERTLTITDLQKATKIWFINSVRKWMEVELV